MKLPKRAVGIAGLLSAAALALTTTERQAIAADHLDPPNRTDPAFDTTPDRSADIADIYAWHTADNLIMALTFAGPNPGSLPATYDRDILYTINISNAGSPTDAEVSIRFRFGQDGSKYGVEISGLPDGGAPLVGPVEQTLTRNGILARAGLYDDPFFFDLQGFRETRSTGTLSFVSSRSFFTGQNDTAMVLQIPRRFVENGSNQINIWVTSARIGGQLQ